MMRSLAAGFLLLIAALGSSAAAPQEKVLRYALESAETGFDPAQIDDEYSRTVTAHIFESLYGYDPIALPPRVVPLTATAMPEISADFRSFTVHVKPGIFFTDDPAFKGKPRELVAEDYVYSLKRHADPAVKSPLWAGLDEQGILGLAELREKARKTGKPFEYDTPIEGLKSLDRYTLQIRTAQPRPRLRDVLAASDVFGAVAREVVEANGGDVMGHPVGTGPFMLKSWRRSSQIVLERNPAYRERYYESEPAADDAEGQAIAKRLRGKRIPMIDRVELSIIDETQPRWLAFLNGQHDMVYKLPSEFISLALPQGKLAPNLAKRGMQLFHALASDAALIFFNMDDPTIGGYKPENVALRRAVSLAWDTRKEIDLLRRGQAVIAQSMVMPYTSGYDPAYKSEMGDFDLARANALLDTYGYVDRDGDGWREMPDGSPLVLDYATQPTALYRAYAEMFRANLERVHIRTRFTFGQWPEQFKQARAGKLMLWFMGQTAASADGQDAVASLYSKQIGGQNFSRFKNPELDAIYERMQVLPDGPEREALFFQAKRIQAAWMPVKTHVHRIGNDMAQAWVVGYRRPLFRNDFWENIDIDLGKLPKP